MTADEWSWWRDALAGKGPEIHADVAHSGFYKLRRSKGGPWLPVMIRIDGEGVLRCRVAGDSSVDPLSIWTYCAGNPVSKEDAKHAFETGSFPGDAPTIGDNSGDLSLAEQIKDYAGRALAWFKKNGIKDKTSSDIAANYRAELIRLSKEADAQRIAEKKPHDAAAAAVQAKWKPLIEEADNAGDEIRKGLTVWMNAEEARLENERAAKFQAELDAANAARREVEAQRVKNLQDDPIAALTSDPEPLPDLPPIPEPVKVSAGGQSGRKTGLRQVTKYVVTDYAAALAHVKDHPDVRAAVEKVAAAQARTGAKVPGVETKIEKVAA